MTSCFHTIHPEVHTPFSIQFGHLLYMQKQDCTDNMASLTLPPLPSMLLSTHSQTFTISTDLTYLSNPITDPHGTRANYYQIERSPGDGFIYEAYCDTYTDTSTPYYRPDSLVIATAGSFLHEKFCYPGR